MLAANAGVGDTVFLGHYEQDGDSANGKEMIEWMVVDSSNDRILLVSKTALEIMAYDESTDKVSWEDSSIRIWLNGAFINDAFTNEEQEDILQTTLLNSTASEEEGAEIQKTRDKIFLLSADDLDLYFPKADSRKCVLSTQAGKSGIKTGPDGSCNWWLRSLNLEKNGSVQTVSGVDGSILDSSYEFQNAVRPAMWIKSD
jgi:hypothetical protein